MFWVCSLQFFQLFINLIQSFSGTAVKCKGIVWEHLWMKNYFNIFRSVRMHFNCELGRNGSYKLRYLWRYTSLRRSVIVPGPIKASIGASDMSCSKRIFSASVMHTSVHASCMKNYFKNYIFYNFRHVT